MKRLLKALREFKFLKTVNVIYEHEYTGTLFVDRCLAMDLPNTGDAIIYNGLHYRVGTRWFNKDENCIEIDLADL